MVYQYVTTPFIVYNEEYLGYLFGHKLEAIQQTDLNILYERAISHNPLILSFRGDKKKNLTDPS